MRIQSFVFLSLVIASACTGGQGGDPGETSGGRGAGAGGRAGRETDEAGGAGGAGGRDMGDDCYGERWMGRTAPAQHGSCTEGQPDGTFGCTCWEDPDGEDERTRIVTAVSCKAALLEVCEIDLDAPRVCTSSEVGTCLTTDEDGTFSCQCEGGTELVEVEASSCGDALSELCTVRCESAFGGCQQSISDENGFGCRCTGDEENLVVAVGFSTCEDALVLHCGERCSDEAGECASDGEGAFACECEDTTGSEVSFASIGGIQPGACYEGLRQACGEVIQPPLSTCESSYQEHDVRCEALPRIVQPNEPAQTMWMHHCTCDGGEPEVLEALTCHRALQASCPSALPPTAAPVGSGDLGALCETANDCTFDSCYVPGTMEDPICSAPCESDSDCPEGSLCAVIAPRGGHCFAICESDAECGLRNDAENNPLYCAPRSGIDSADLGGEGDERGICIQGSEP